MTNYKRKYNIWAQGLKLMKYGTCSKCHTDKLLMIFSNTEYACNQCKHIQDSPRYETTEYILAHIEHIKKVRLSLKEGAL